MDNFYGQNWWNSSSTCTYGGQLRLDIRQRALQNTSGSVEQYKTAAFWCYFEKTTELVLRRSWEVETRWEDYGEVVARDKGWKVKIKGIDQIEGKETWNSSW